MRHRLRLMLGTALLAGLTMICSAGSDPLKIAFVYVGPIADGGCPMIHT